MSTFNFLKRFFSLLLVGVLILPMASCGDDDDDKGPISNGMVTIEYVGASTFTKYAYKASFHSGHQEVHGSVLDYLKNGATFSVDLSEIKPSEVEYVLGEPYIDPYSSIRWQLETADAITVGAELTMTGSHWPEPDFDNAGWLNKKFDGKVIVKSVSGNQVTLQFKDFKFKRIMKFVVGNSIMQDLIANGEITYNLDKTIEEQMKNLK